MVMNIGIIFGLCMAIIYGIILYAYCKFFWKKISDYKKDKSPYLIFLFSNFIIQLISFRYILLFFHCYTRENYNTSLLTWMFITASINLLTAFKVGSALSKNRPE